MLSSIFYMGTLGLKLLAFSEILGMFPDQQVDVFSNRWGSLLGQQESRKLIKSMSRWSFHMRQMFISYYEDLWTDLGDFPGFKGIEAYVAFSYNLILGTGLGVYTGKSAERIGYEDIFQTGLGWCYLGWTNFPFKAGYYRICSASEYIK